MYGRIALTLLSVALASSCSALPNDGSRAAISLSSPFNAAATPANDCWARLYEQKHLQGRALTVAGPARVSELPAHLGFPWEPRYESLIVGSGAVLTVFADPELHAMSATFAPDSTIRDLDREMGLFRRVRSLSVACVRAHHAS